MKKVKIRFTGDQKLIDKFIEDFNYIPNWDLLYDSDYSLSEVSKPYPNRGSDDVRIYADLCIVEEDVWEKIIPERIRWKHSEKEK